MFAAVTEKNIRCYSDMFDHTGLAKQRLPLNDEWIKILIWQQAISKYQNNSFPEALDAYGQISWHLATTWRNEVGTVCMIILGIYCTCMRSIVPEAGAGIKGSDK